MSVALFTLLFVNESIAQSTAITGMVGLLNAKARVQYEALLGDQSSVGVNLNYYFVNWTGPKLEAFYRMYLGRDGNEEGVFIQLKGGTGILSNLEYAEAFTYNGSSYNMYENKTWQTIGGGIAIGGKVVGRSGFVFESHIGYHFWSPPTYRYTADYDTHYESALQNGAAIGETIGWYLTTGFPLDVQMKVGWQF